MNSLTDKKNKFFLFLSEMLPFNESDCVLPLKSVMYKLNYISLPVPTNNNISSSMVEFSRGESGALLPKLYI